MRPADDIEKMIENWNDTTSAQMDERVLADARRALEQSQTQAASAEPSLRRVIMRSPITKLAAAAAIIIAVPIVLSQFGGSLESIAWAEVAERFESVPFFSVVVYASPSTSVPGKRIQIWKSEDSRVRVEEADKVILADFADGNNAMLTFNRSTRQPGDASMIATALLKAFCQKGQFSLDTLIGVLSSEAMVLVPVETADTAASREIVVFEAKRQSTGETLRIWALRDSKLPIQMQFRDPRNDEYGDFVFDYTEKKDAAFFDPEAFKHQTEQN